MQHRLREKEREAIAEVYGKHPLYMTCRYAFKNSESKLTILQFAPEEVFVEAVDVIDNVIVERDDLNDYLSLLWDDLLTKIRRWEPKAQEAELNIAVSAILYAVAEAVSSVRMQDYDDLAAMLLRILKSHSAISAIEHSKLLDDIAHYQEEVEEWMLDYLDSEAFLSDEISESLRSKKDGQKGGNVIHDVETITDTFIINCDEKQEIMNIRLQLIYKGLKNYQFISSKTGQDIILHLFQGEPIDTKIEWTKGIGELKYLFETLLDKGYIRKSGTAGHWQMVCAHFKLMKTKKDGSVAYKALTPEQFKNGHSMQTKELDNIVSLFNPNLINADRLRKMWANQPNEDKLYKRDILDSGMRFK